MNSSRLEQESEESDEDIFRSDNNFLRIIIEIFPATIPLEKTHTRYLLFLMIKNKIIIYGLTILLNFLLFLLALIALNLDSCSFFTFGSFNADIFGRIGVVAGPKLNKGFESGIFFTILSNFL